MDKTIMERKDLLIGVGVIVVIALLVFGLGSRNTEAPEEIVPGTMDTTLSGSESETAVGPSWEADSSNLDLGNISYILEGESVQLTGGQSAISDSGRKVSLLEGPAFTDLNGDGAKDAVVLLREDTGGTGIFYHAAAVLSVSLGGGEATNSIFLGDRIRIKQIIVANGVISISILERKEGDPMTAEPTEPKTRTFRLQGSEFIEI